MEGAPSEPAKKGFWGRNWKWLVPVGCLSLLACCGCGVGGIVLGAFNLIRNNEVTQQALAAAQANPEVQQALGSPLEMGWMLQGNINTSNGEGTADLRIPISGPKGEGTLVIEAKERGNAWQFDQLQVEVPGRAPIVLAAASGSSPNQLPPQDEQQPEEDVRAPDEEQAQDEPPPPEETNQGE